MPIQTVCVSERTTSGYQITSLSKHEAFNRCETAGPESFHTSGLQPTQNNRKQTVMVQYNNNKKKKLRHIVQKGHL